MPDNPGMGEFHIKRITLPSGKVVELVYFEAAGIELPVNVTPVEAAPAAGEGEARGVRELEACPECDADKVCPVDWTEVADGFWELDLRCPECEWRSTGLYDQDEVDRYDDVLADATDDMITELERLTHENMADDIRRFVTALERDAILPFDF
jgi:hypothetical protein